MFKTARIKLTAWYLLIITLISASFSFVIYRFLSREIDRFAMAQKVRFERQAGADEEFLPPKPGVNRVLVFTLDSDLIQDTQRRLLFALVSINGIIIVVSGGLGYFLAGRTLRPIQQMLDEQNRFISDSSHELRTPLTALKSSLEVALRDKNLSLEEAKKLTKDNLNEVNQLQYLTDSLLELSRYQNPNLKLKITRVVISEIASQAVKDVSNAAQKKNISILNKVKQSAIKADKDKLRELFVILLENAVKYSQPNKEVIISSFKNNGRIILKFKDTGIGISSKDIPHIFDRFYQADKSRSNIDTGGFGLGLSIAKNIVESHHGTIEVESKLGKGTVFLIALPVNPSKQS